MEQSRSRPMAGRTVLVTGGSGGIGRATALGLTAAGVTTSPAIGKAGLSRRPRASAALGLFTGL